MGTGKLPYVTWQRLKADKVPMSEWPEYVRRAYERAYRTKLLGRDMVKARPMPGAHLGLKLRSIGTVPPRR